MSLDIDLEKEVTEIQSVFNVNITHNLTDMADEAGIYMAMWRPNEIGATNAGDLINILQKALNLMESDPERFKKHNPKNGWGDYDILLNVVKKYLHACIEHPESKITVC